MIKNYLMIGILLVGSCSRPTEVTQFSDDYVLIEFAAKLEEDYQQIYPEPLENPKPNSRK